MIEVRPYQSGDLGRMPIRPVDVMEDDPEEYINGLACTGFVDGMPIMVGGIAVISEGVGHAWSYMTPFVKNHRIEVIRLLSREINEIMTNVGLWRVQITVQAHKDRYIRFARLLGFVEEGVLRKAAPNKMDLYMMAIVRE